MLDGIRVDITEALQGDANGDADGSMLKCAQYEREYVAERSFFVGPCAIVGGWLRKLAAARPKAPNNSMVDVLQYAEMDGELS